VPINEVIDALGSWYINLDQSTPRRILDKLGYFGHVVVHAARQNHPELIGDGLLKSARFVGVVRDKQFTGINGSTAPNTNQLQGSGMAYWLGDEDGKGSVIEAPGTALVNASFTEGVRALLPYSGAVREGTLHAVAGVWSGSYVWVSPRQALDDFCSYFSSDFGECEWRVNGDGTLDAGRIEDLYVTEPQAIIARKGAGQDIELRGVSGDAQTDEDVQDFSTRVVVLAQGTGDSVATGAANINPNLNPYVDLFGNSVYLTRLISQEGTDASNAPASAVLQLNRFLRPRSALQLSSDEYDLRGAFAPGDYVWVWDPDAGLLDTTGANEVYFRGERLFPIKLRLSELTWPVTKGMGVAYRAQSGEWIDLTDYIVWEDPANVDVVVGATVRTLLNSSSGEPVGGRPKGDSSIPDVVEWELPFGLSSYQSLTGITRSQVVLAWHRPNNTDGTAIIDLDHYEIRWRTSAHQILPVPWGYLWQSSYQWDQLVQWDGLLPAVEGPWQYTAVGPDQQQFLLGDLTPGVPYDVEVRAVDTASPPNFGFWNATQTFETLGDPFPPSAPAPPFVAASPISVQVTHTLGKSSGGTFNLEADLHHLEIHAAYEPAFTPTTASLIGRMLCNQGTLSSQTPIVATFTLASTADVWVKVVAVDAAGNQSGPSSGVQSSAELINDEWISNLTVSKITAGTITSQWLVGSDIATAFTGTRAGMNAGGFYAFDQANNQTFEVDAATGSVYMTGVLDTAQNGSRARLAPADLTHILQAPGLYLWAVGSPSPGLIYAVPKGLTTSAGIPSAVGVTSSLNPDTNYVGTMYVQNNRAYLGMRSWMPPDPLNPHGYYLENGTYFASLPDRAEMATVGQVHADGSIDYNGGFVSVANDFSYIGFETATMPQRFFAFGGSFGALNMKGEFLALAGNADRLGLFVGASQVPSGSGGGITVGYGATQTTTHGVVATTGSSGTYVWAESTTTAVLIHYTVNGTFPAHMWAFGVV
jgi:hypothetical protein